MKWLLITSGNGFLGKSMLDYRLRHLESEWTWAELAADACGKGELAAEERLVDSGLENAIRFSV